MKKLKNNFSIPITIGISSLPMRIGIDNRDRNFTLDAAFRRADDRDAIFTNTLQSADPFSGVMLSYVLKSIPNNHINLITIPECSLNSGKSLICPSGMQLLLHSY